MTKLLVVVGGVLVTIGLYLLLTLPVATRAQLEGAYGDLGNDLQKLGGGVTLGAGGLMLLIALVRVIKTGKHDPDLPPEYRV